MGCPFILLCESQPYITCADLIRDIKDPEHPNTLEELNVVSEDSISVEYRTASNEVRNEACVSTPSAIGNHQAPQQGTS